MFNNYSITIGFITLCVYLIINTIFFICYKNKMHKICEYDDDMYDYFSDIIVNNKLIYIFFAIFILSNRNYKDKMIIDIYKYKIKRLNNDMYYAIDTDYYEKKINEIKKIIYKLELKIKIKKLK